MTVTYNVNHITCKDAANFFQRVRGAGVDLDGNWLNKANEGHMLGHGGRLAVSSAVCLRLQFDQLLE